jgi:hypothetical protein
LESVVAVRVCQGELIDVIFLIEDESETQHVMVLVHRRPIVEDMFLGQSLPLGPGRRLYEWRHRLIEEIVVLVDVDDVENDSLVLLAVVNGEVEPKPVPRIASVRAQTQVIFKFTNEQHIPEISGLESSVEA